MFYDTYVAKDCDHGLVDLQDWNPMEDDYLSKRNIYKIDDEDTGLALDGYSKLCCMVHVLVDSMVERKQPINIIRKFMSYFFYRKYWSHLSLLCFWEALL